MKFYRLMLLLGLLVGVGVAVARLLRRSRQALPSVAPNLPHATTQRRLIDALDNDISDEPPPPPAPPRLDLYTRALNGNEQAQRLWLTLHREAFRQRSEGFRDDWAFPLHAVRFDLGAPLAKGARLTFAGKEYAYQPFARDTLFNEVPNWSAVRSLSALLEAALPTGGLARALLEASFAAAGSTLQPEWAFHRLAVQAQLGPPLKDSYRITVGEHDYSMQIFAGDTLYSHVPNWSHVERLSATPAGPLAEALWRETYTVANAAYDPAAPAQQAAQAAQLGTPLTGVYELDVAGLAFQVQIFTGGAVYKEPDADRFSLQSDLARASVYTPDAAPAPAALIAPDAGSASDATSSADPVFAQMPVAGEPRISQLYGYTKWSAGGGRTFYGATQGRHPGIDFAVPVGTPLLSVGHGLVVYAGPSSGAPFGGAPPAIAIVRYGSLYGIYGHSSEMRVRKGQLVTPGQVVTLSGDFGGPHLHFEVRPVPSNVLSNTDPNQPAVNAGTTMNPLPYFAPALQAIIERWYRELGGDSHFCRGSLRDQEPIRFGGPVETRPCT